MSKFTVNKVVSSAGRTWHPGEVLSDRAANAVDAEHLVPVDDPDLEGPDSWYKGATIKSVVASVDGDPDRAAFALEKERARPEDRQRTGVFEALLPLVPDGDTDEGEPDDGSDGQTGEG